MSAKDIPTQTSALPHEADRDAFKDHGVDTHSVVGDAQFVDPAAGNFQVAKGSPALALGFHNFPMDQFGVRDPELRAQARTPEMPSLRNVASDPTSIVYDWLGGKIRYIEGAEYSAWGISSEIGGVMVFFAPGYREIDAAGLRDGDLINTCNSQRVKTVEDLVRIINGAPADQAITFKVQRIGNQGSTSVDEGAQGNGNLTKPYRSLPETMEAARTLRKTGTIQNLR